ncbi:uncharacterized protein LOC143219885 [Lasioglossum baleicum]|uniref:uncharacterized protein LOC143219885 n=1 Tax=Lasioglossum baleicum TaxID=434251 RepID=UPI003FCDFF79
MSLSRVIRAYRTTSLDALCVLSGLPPLTLLAEERRRIFLRAINVDRTSEYDYKAEMKNIKETERQTTMELWQTRWDIATHGRKTHTLIPKISEWIEWGPRTLDFHLTQVLTGHGCFADYLHKIGKRNDICCIACKQSTDSPEHTILECSVWNAERDALFNENGPLNWSDLIAWLNDPIKMPRLRQYINIIMTKKEEIERATQREERNLAREGRNALAETECGRSRQVTLVSLTERRSGNVCQGPHTKWVGVLTKADMNKMFSNDVSREIDVVKKGSLRPEAVEKEGQPCPEAVVKEGQPRPEAVVVAGPAVGSVADTVLKERIQEFLFPQSISRSRPRSRPSGLDGTGDILWSITGGSTRDIEDDIVSVRSLGSAVSCPAKRRGSPILDSPRSKRQDRAPKVYDHLADMRGLLPGELASLIVSHSRDVERLARRSGNLKGTFVRDFKESARKIEAAARELERRGAFRPSLGSPAAAPSAVVPANSPSADLWDELRAENLSLKKELQETRETLGAIREEMMAMKRRQDVPTSPSPSLMAPEAPEPVVVADPSDVGVHVMAPRGDAVLLAQLGALIDAKLNSFQRELGLDRRDVLPSARVGALKPLGTQLAKESRATTIGGPANLLPGGPVPLGGVIPPAKRKKKKKKKTIAGDGNVLGVALTTPVSHPLRLAAPPGVQPQAWPVVSPPSTGEAWSQVVGRRARREAAALPLLNGVRMLSPKGKPGTRKGSAPRVVAPPRTAAVTITVPEGSMATYEEAIKVARQDINLGDLGIEALTWKRAINGGLIIQIPGAEGASRADVLAAKMYSALRGMDVRVSRPVKKAEFRLTGLDISVTPQEVVTAVAVAGGCAPDLVRVGEIKIPPNGLGTIWVQCPAAAALKIERAQKVKVGWSLARVVVLATRPLQCFRCLALGHVRQRCTAAVDRSSLCYRCGDPSHRAADCVAPPRCVVCEAVGRPADHKVGSRACCPPSKPRNSRRKGGGADPPTATGAKPGGAVQVLPRTPPKTWMSL